jgi:hypothetical protein
MTAHRFHRRRRGWGVIAVAVIASLPLGSRGIHLRHQQTVSFKLTVNVLKDS